MYFFPTQTGRVLNSVVLVRLLGFFCPCLFKLFHIESGKMHKFCQRCTVVLFEVPVTKYLFTFTITASFLWKLYRSESKLYTSMIRLKFRY